MRVFYFSESIKKGSDAGVKARNDVEHILESKYKKLTPYTNGRLFNKIFSITKILPKIHNNAVIIQYPMPIGYNVFLPILCKLSKVYLIIHDLDGLRFGKYNTEETKRLNNCTCIVAHNKKMIDYLDSLNLVCKNIKSLQLFDYLISREFEYNHSMDNELICFAGNLVKSNFIYNMPEKITSLGVNIYGSNYDKTKNTNLNYCGTFDSEIIHEELKGKFGLIWDGESIESCIGTYGEYMRYNNPHKVSMYIAAGMPIVCWEQAAIADFIKENGIGILISNIDNLSTLKNIDIKTYQKLQRNVYKIRDKILKGYYLLQSLNDLDGV
jgi:hypothetical protein